MLERTYLLYFPIAIAAGVAACGVSQETSLRPGIGGSPGGPPEGGTDAPACAYGQILCDGNKAQVCDGQGSYINVTSCITECKDGLGCVECVPNTGVCEAGLAKVCDATGSKEEVFACKGPGMQCEPDGCHGPCSPTTLGESYQGCEFWPTVTANSVWSAGFHFGVVLGNPSGKVKATVEITHPMLHQPISVSIPSGGASAVPLDWLAELKGADWETPYVPASSSQGVHSLNGAYHVVSDIPIVAVQFNPLESKVEAAGCPTVPAANGGCYSYSNDASLLIPTQALARSYVVTGYHAWHADAFPPPSGTGKLDMGDLIAITATQANTDVTLSLRPNQGVVGYPGLPTFMAGQPARFTMGAGEVIEPFTPGTSDTDTFSGAEITSTNRIQLFSGVGCASIPENPWQCGHVEDSVLPVDALGKEYVVPVLTSGAGARMANTIRIQSISDGTALTFEPTSLNAVTLDRGQFLEIPNVIVDVRITANTPFAVTQYLNARPKTGLDTSAVGGPNQLSVPPIGQFKTGYSFVVSPFYNSNFVSIIAPTGASVALDKVSIAADKFTAVGASGMSVSRAGPLAGDHVHTLLADKPIGIVIYGLSDFSSYVYSGGLDLKPITAVARYR